MITLRRLRAENFKGLRSVDLTFPERGSVLIEGHNEAGKSTLFEAVYVALYGEPLVGEDSRPRLEEVIQHGQPQALVELTFSVGVQELTVQRVLRRQQTQRVRLTIRRVDGTEDVVNRPTAVNKRILQELNNLDGDNLRNSCLVEQKELGRLEEMDSSKREQAIQKLLGLERLTKLSEQFRFKREQERELEHARRLLELAQMQEEIRLAEAEQHARAERLDAALIAAHLAEHDVLQAKRADINGQIEACKRQESELRDRLARAERIRGQLGACDDTRQQLERASAQRETVERLARQLTELDDIEQQSLPATRAHFDQVVAALEVVTDAERKHEATRNAATAVQDAQRAVDELERAEDAVRQRADVLETTRRHAERRRQATMSARERNQQRLTELAAQQERVNLALERVTAWEQARDLLEAAQRDVQAAEQRVRTLQELRTTLRQREEAAHSAAEAAARAEQGRQEAETHRRQAEGHAALRDWVRLKEVEAALSSFAHDRTRLEDERKRAAAVHTAAQGRARPPLYAALAATLLAALALAAGTVWIWAWAFGGALAVAAILLWVGYVRVRTAAQSSKVALDAAEQRLHDLSLQYQAAVRAGGDPALLSQRERELAAASFAVPTSLDAARALLGQFPAEVMPDYQRARAAVDAAVATAAQLAAAVRQAHTDVEHAQAAVCAAEAEGDAEVLLREARVREAAQHEAVGAAEQGAREASSADLSWPMTSAELQTTRASCSAQQRAIEQATSELETTAVGAERDDANAVTQSEQALRTAEEAAAALRVVEPQVALAKVQAECTGAEDAARQADAKAQSLTRDLGLAPNRASVEAERGRIEERLRTLESQIATRPALSSELADAQAARARVLGDTSTAIQAIAEAARPLTASSASPMPAVWMLERDERQLARALSQIRTALESVLAELDETAAQDALETILHEEGTLRQRLRAVLDQLATEEGAIRSILTTHHLPAPAHYTSAELSTVWPLADTIAGADKDHLQAELEQAGNRLFAAQDRERRLTEELEHPGTPLSIEECEHCLHELDEQRAICQRAARMIQDARERIARQVLPTTERNMQLLLPELTAQRYWDVRLTPPESEDGQPGQLDYRIRVWDQTAGRYVAKNLFSGGTRDQCSLALRLAFALATLPQELGVAPGFIFLDEPLSAFDAQRAQALVSLLTTGTIAQQFAQVVVISHHHAFDRRAFQYHVRMEGGQAVESDLPESHALVPQPALTRLAASTVMH